jgi:hypothetical protein
VNLVVLLPFLPMVIVLISFHWFCPFLIQFPVRIYGNC